jgi:short-subunit dehydrogenase
VNIAGKAVVITGAGGGIGRALAAALANGGARLALVGRRQATLDATVAALPPNSDATVIVADLATADGCSAAVEQSTNALGKVDILINNAGVTAFGAFADEDPAALARLLMINVLAPQLLTRQVLPGMLAAGDGKIVNIGSGFGRIGFPYHVSYSASKFAIRGFSEALRRELNGSGVSVLYVAPRATETAMVDHRITAAAGMAIDAPGTVAEAIIKGIQRDVAEVAMGSGERFFARLNGLFPGLVDNGLRDKTEALKALALKPAAQTLESSK